VPTHALIILTTTCGDAGVASKPDCNIGDCEPFFNSHDALDRDKSEQEETRNDARSVVKAVRA
jgi:hypothetical protein